MVHYYLPFVLYRTLICLFCTLWYTPISFLLLMVHSYLHVVLHYTLLSPLCTFATLLSPFCTYGTLLSPSCTLCYTPISLLYFMVHSYLPSVLYGTLLSLFCTLWYTPLSFLYFVVNSHLLLSVRQFASLFYFFSLVSVRLVFYYVHLFVTTIFFADES